MRSARNPRRGIITYRVGQGLRMLLSPIFPLDGEARERAIACLPPAAAAAFRALPRADQRHALSVYTQLATEAESDTDLLAAALLHDIGKHPDVGITQRTARVLLRRSPRLLEWASRDGRTLRRWRHGMAQLRDHAAIGADRAASWGCTPATAAIIRASHDADAPDAVRRLQTVDDRS